MSNAGKRALITGIHGFTGRYMAAELKAHGYELSGWAVNPPMSQLSSSRSG
jgi:GDP-D-mannose dehydratase